MPRNEPDKAWDWIELIPGSYVLQDQREAVVAQVDNCTEADIDIIAAAPEMLDLLTQIGDAGKAFDLLLLAGQAKTLAARVRRTLNPGATTS